MVELIEAIAWPIVTLVVLLWFGYRVRHWSRIIVPASRTAKPRPLLPSPSLPPLGADEIELLFDIGSHPWHIGRQVMCELADGRMKTMDQIECGDRIGERTVVHIRRGSRA